MAVVRIEDGIYNVNTSLGENKIVKHTPLYFHNGRKRWEGVASLLATEALLVTPGLNWDLDGIDGKPASPEAVLGANPNILEGAFKVAEQNMATLKAYQFFRTPMDHQLLVWSVCAGMRYVPLFMDMGTGKTFITLNLMRYWRPDEPADSIRVVFCPKYLMSVWAEETRLAYPEAKMLVMDEKTRWPKKVERLKEDGYDLLIANYDVTHTKGWEGFMALKDRISVIVWDESTRMKNQKTVNWKSMNLLMRAMRKIGRDPRTILMTGVPNPQGYDDLFAQLVLCDKGLTLGDHYWKFRMYTQKDVGGFFPHWEVTKKGAKAISAAVEKRALVMNKEDCLTLPPRTIQPIVVAMTDQQENLYAKAQNYGLLTDEDATTVKAVGVLVKLSEATSGFLLDDDGYVVGKVRSAKMDALASLMTDLMSESPDTKVLVWARFIRDIEAIAEELKEYEPLCLYGKTSAQAESILSAFRTLKKHRVLVLNQQTGAFGLNLQVASASIHYSYDYSYELWKQSLDRIYRAGQEKPVTHYPLICKGTVDEEVMMALRNKENAVEAIMRNPKSVIYKQGPEVHRGRGRPRTPTAHLNHEGGL